jgi:protein-tyrosine phosphatase
MSMRMDIHGMANFRDVGGYPARGGVTRHGQLYRSDALTGITPTGVADLAALRIGVVVDLRSDIEVAQDQTRYVLPGATLVRVPIETGSPASIVEGDHVSLELLYRHLATEAGWSLTAAVSAIAESGHTPVLVNCTAGKDRTGLVIALALEAAGVERTAVVADYTQSALNLDGEWLDQTLSLLVSNGVPVSPALIEAIGGAPDRAMRHVLEWLDVEYGSVVGYLTAHGLIEGAVDALVEKLVA